VFLKGASSAEGKLPARDIYHDICKKALIKEGWKITHDPYLISFGTKNVFVDLGAERMLAAEKNEQRIAVEIKSFRSASDIQDLEMAVGQYVFYRSLLTRCDTERKLFLAVPESVFASTLNEAIARPVLEDLSISVIAFDPEKEVICKWII
jgi:hypothetical protein